MPGIKVLLVEDDWIIGKEISYSLQDLGFDVVGICDSGEEALKQIKIMKPDIVLLDIDLSSEMTGIDVAKKLKLENAVPFIFLTALADSETIEKANFLTGEQKRDILFNNAARFLRLTESEVKGMQ